MKLKQVLAVLMAVTLSVAMLSGCGKEEQKTETAASTGSNIIKKSEPQAGDTSANKHFEVQLDERDEDTAYQFGIEDLSYVDTVTGGSVAIGMTIEEIEKVTGSSMTDDSHYRIYDGLIVQFDDSGKAVALLISGGLFMDEAQSTRFVTPRGVGLLTGFEDFVKAYGDLYNEGQATSTTGGEAVMKPMNNAVRYFTVDGDKVEYLGAELTEDMKSKHAGKIYMKDFMFDNETNKVTVMRVINVDYIGK